MYESYTRQCVPSLKYRALLGSAICVFNSNNSFIIENILKSSPPDKYTWHQLIDLMSGRLKDITKKNITDNSNADIATLFEQIVDIRNRIVHSFQTTAPPGVSDDTDNQMLATKYKDGRQEYITEDFLIDFINKNQKLSTMLHEYRGD